MGSELKLGPTACGKLALFITEDVSWENFPEKAKFIAKKMGATKLFSLTGPDMRLWVVLVKLRPYFLTFDDFPWGLSLDPTPLSSDRVTKLIFEKLSE